MTFESLLPLLLFIPLYYCLVKCRRKATQQYFVHLHLFSLKPERIKWEWILKLLALSGMLIALASPVFIDKNDPLNRNGIDIVLSLDASGSMSASGFDRRSRQSRFEITQKIAQDFVLGRLEDNIGVVLFGDFAFIASPVTYEKEIVSEMIGYLSYGMAGENTAIGEGIAMGVRALQHSKAHSKVIILLTDGEHNSGRISPQEATALAIERGIKIYTIGIGAKGDFDAAMLKKVAEDGGGEYFAAYDNKELEDVYEEIDTLERSRIKSKAYLQKEYYYHYALLAAFVAMLILLTRRRLL